MTYEETVAVVYRIVSGYPMQTNRFTDETIESMAREWHNGLKNLSSDGVMEAVTRIVMEQKWMPSLSELILKILDVQYGTDEEIIRKLDRIITLSSDCIIFGQVTEDQEQGYKELTPFQQMIVRSPAEFNTWMMKDYEWKQARVLRVKREIQYGSHKLKLSEPQGNTEQGKQIGQDFIKALAEKNNYGN